jgi:hypothetical protein
MCCPKKQREGKCKVEPMCSMALNVLERDEEKECKVEHLCSKALKVLQRDEERKNGLKKYEERQNAKNV